MSKKKPLKGDVTFAHVGSKITLPEDMSIANAIEWLKRKQTADEQIVAVNYSIKCYPTDGAVAFYKALKEIYGWVEGTTTESFFGNQPPLMVGIHSALNETVQVPWGRLQVPAIEGYLQTDMRVYPNVEFVIGGAIKQKHAAEVEQIYKTTNRILKENSIYKGKAIEIDCSWMREDRQFDFFNDTPKFIDLVGLSETDLIVNDSVKDVLNVGLFGPIEYSQAYRDANISLKRGILMEGPFGTGKTLTAAITALKAIRNNWTFLYLKDVRDLAEAIKIARHYAPSVLFAEDVDRAVGLTRNSEVDNVLNTLDGVDSKNQELIVVLTTNFADKINPALKRPGRIDLVVSLEAPDAATATNLVRLHGGNVLSSSFDCDSAGQLVAGKIPAVIHEIMMRAKAAAVVRLSQSSNGSPINIVGNVTNEDVAKANDSMEMHLQLMHSKKKKVSFAEKCGKAIGDAMARRVLETMISVKGLSDSRTDYVPEETIALPVKG